MSITNRPPDLLYVILCLLISMTSCSPVVALPTATTIPPTATPAPTLQPGDSERKVMVNDLERSYLFHIPPGLDSFHPAPVVFAFHGLGDTPQGMQFLTSFDEIANKSGFLVVYPEGIDLSWNAGGKCCGNAVTKQVDEQAFVHQILADLGTIANIDTKRIYATGFSNGGLLGYRLACEMSDTFAAVAPVAGGLVYDPCQPSQPISIIQIHGMADSTVPYEGGGEFNLPSVEQNVTMWSKLDGCAGSPEITKENIITHTAYTSCKVGTAVELYALESGGHNWPTKYVWDASQMIWDFFAAHPKP